MNVHSPARGHVHVHVPVPVDVHASDNVSNNSTHAQMEQLNALQMEFQAQTFERASLTKLGKQRESTQVEQTIPTPIEPSPSSCFVASEPAFLVSDRARVYTPVDSSIEQFTVYSTGPHTESLHPPSASADSIASAAAIDSQLPVGPIYTHSPRIELSHKQPIRPNENETGKQYEQVYVQPVHVNGVPQVNLFPSRVPSGKVNDHMNRDAPAPAPIESMSEFVPQYPSRPSTNEAESILQDFLHQPSISVPTTNGQIRPRKKWQAPQPLQTKQQPIHSLWEDEQL
jgi:hypothetical protein